MAQPQQQQQPYQTLQYQYPQQLPQPGPYASTQGQYTHQYAPPPPQSYQQNPQGSAPQPQYGYQAPLPQAQQPYSPQPSGSRVPRPPPGPPPISQPSGVQLLLGPPPGAYENIPSQRDPCSGRKAVLTKYTQFHVFKHSAFPRQDPSEQDLSFAICEGCYNTHLSCQSSFASSFEPFQSPDSIGSGGGVEIPTSRALCDFWLPVVKDTFYKKCMPQNSIKPLVDLANELQDLAPCPGNQVWDGGAVYSSASMPNCAMCPRCFELYLSPAFEKHFKREVRSSGQHWTCDLGKDPGYVYDLLISVLKAPNPDFNTLARGVNDRLNIATCPGDGKPVPASKDGLVRMYNLQHVNLGACSECYYDYLALSPFSHSFVATSHDPKVVTLVCDLASPTAKFLMTKSLSTSDLSIWQTSLDTFTKLPKCAFIKGVPEEDIQTQTNQLGALANWYSVVHCPNIEVCPSCYHCVMTPLGASHLLKPITRPLQAAAVRVCNFSIGAGGVTSFDPNDFATTLQWRGFMLRTLLERLAEDPSPSRDYSSFLSLASILNAAGPPCGANVRGFKRPSGRRYFGRLRQNQGSSDCEVVMCEECYSDLVKETSLNQWLGQELTEAVYRNDKPPWAKEGLCQPWSKTSKAVLRRAAEANDFTIFARHWNHRL